MSDNAKVSNANQHPSVSRLILLKDTYAYHFTMLLFFSAIAVTFSFAFIPIAYVISFKPPETVKALIDEIRSYNFYRDYGIGWWALFRIFRLLRVFVVNVPWVNAILRVALTTAVSLWGIIALKMLKRHVIIPICLLAVLFSTYLMSFIFNIINFQHHPDAWELIGRTLINYFRSFQTIVYFLLFVLCVVCLVIISSRFNSNPRRMKPARKDVSGVGGWLIVSIIRYAGACLNFFFIFILAVLASVGIKIAPLMNQELIFTAVHWSMSLVVLMISVMSLVLIIKLVGKSSSFPAMAVSFEALLITFGTIVSYYLVLIAVLISRSISDLIVPVGTQLISIVWSVIFIIYYNKSDRVKNTFVK